MAEMLKDLIYDLASEGDKDGIETFCNYCSFSELCIFLEWAKKEGFFPEQVVLPLFDKFVNKKKKEEAEREKKEEDEASKSDDEEGKKEDNKGDQDDKENSQQKEDEKDDEGSGKEDEETGQKKKKFGGDLFESFRASKKARVSSPLPTQDEGTTEDSSEKENEGED
jgi:hypothetical protein